MYKVKSCDVVTLGYKHDVEYNDHIIRVKINGKFSEAKTSYSGEHKEDAAGDLRAMIKEYKGKCGSVVLEASAKKLLEQFHIPVPK